MDGHCRKTFRTEEESLDKWKWTKTDDGADDATGDAATAAVQLHGEEEDEEESRTASSVTQLHVLRRRDRFGKACKQSTHKTQGRNVPEAQLSTHHLGIPVVPLVVADGAPPSCVKHLYATFKVFLASDQSQRRAAA